MLSEHKYRIFEEWYCKKSKSNAYDFSLNQWLVLKEYLNQKQKFAEKKPTLRPFDIDDCFFKHIFSKFSFLDELFL